MTDLKDGDVDPTLKKLWFRVDDNRTDQIDICASLLEILRRRTDIDNNPALKKIFKDLIRCSSESADCCRTVDFVTQATFSELERLRVNNGGTALKGDLDGRENFTHEHMVPGEYIFGKIKPPNGLLPGELAELLNQWGFRALVHGRTRKDPNTGKVPDSEIARLDADGRKQHLLWPMDIKDLEAIQSLETIPRVYFPFLRYDAANLFDALIPVNRRATDLRNNYIQYKAGIRQTKKS